MSLDKEAEPGVVEEASVNEFGDDPDRPLIRIPNRRSRGGRASHTQSTTTRNKGRTSSMASSTGGSGGQPPGDESNKLEQPQTSDTTTPPVRTPPAKTDPARTPPAITDPAITPPARTDPARTDQARTPPARTHPARTDPARTDPLSALGVTPLQLVSAAVCLSFALAVGSCMYISNNNTILQTVIDDLSAKMQLNNAAIERLENDVRLLKSRGRPEKDPYVETNTETNQDVIYLRSDIEELRLVTTGLPQKLQCIAGMKTTIDDIRRQVDEDISPSIGRINTELEKTTDEISNIIIPYIAEVKRGVEGATHTISATTNEMNNELKPKIKTLNEDLKKTRYDIKENVKEDFKRLMSSTDAMKEGQDELVNIVARIGNMMKDQKEYLRDKIPNNAAIERLENDVRMLKSRGRPEKDPYVETNTETNQDVIYLRSDIEELRLVTTGLPQKLQCIAGMKTTIDDIRRQVDEDISPSIGRINTELEKTTDEISNIIIPDIAEVKRGVEGATHTISATTNEMNNELKPKIKTLNEDLKKTRYDIKENVNEDFKRLMSSTDAMKEGQAELVNIVAGIGSMTKAQQDKLRDKIEPNMFNKWATTLAILLIVVLQAGSIFAIYVLCGKCQGYGMGDGQADPECGTKNNRNSGGSTLKRNAILNQIPRNRPLQRLVCVISLEPSTRNLHKQITDAVLAGLGVPHRPEVKELLVSSNDDMLRIPAATVNLLFIHFSERHVILEQPGLEIGDRHVTAFQAVKQIGGGLVIVYVRDPESRRLQGNDMYNRNIPVAESPELQRLCDDGAFFSTYDRLTKHQTTSLQRFIIEYLDKF